MEIPAPAPTPTHSVRLGAVAWRAVPVLAAALALGLGALAALRFLILPLAFLVIAISIGEALEPIVAWLTRHRLSRGVAIGVVFGALFILIALLAMLAVPALVAQGGELGARGPDLVRRLQRWVAEGDRVTGGRVSQFLGQSMSRLGDVVVQLPMLVLSSVLDLLVIVFLAVYWVAGSPSLKRFCLSLLPPGRREPAAEVLEEMGRAMGGYVRGAAINAVIMGSLAWLGLTLIGVDYAVVLGLVTMLGEPIPYIGPIIAAIPVILVALLQSPGKAVLALGLYTLLQQLEGHILTPNIMHRATQVPQTLVIFALVAGGAVGGLLGAVVALPLAGAVRVFTVRVIAPAIRRRTGAPAVADEVGL